MNISGRAQQKQSEVLIISTIHGAHKINPNYSYDALFSFIEKFNPDIVGVEIRNEDIDSSLSYLKINYPYEMYAPISKYADKKIVGFDWLGEDIIGKPIPENYWKEQSIIKQLQLKLNKDSILKNKLSVTDIIQEEKKKLVLNSTLTELNDGRYDIINALYYSQLELLLKDTEYKAITDFYKKRDQMIANRIIEIVKKNRGKKMIFLIGADHRDFTIKRVKEELKIPLESVH